MKHPNTILENSLLDEQERDCLRLIAKGKSTYNIALEKQLSEFSINFYLQSTKNKLHAKNLAHAIYRAFELGILP